jgi:hypothetical protein
MQSLNAKVSKQLVNQAAKYVKRQGDEDDDVVMLESAVKELKNQALSLEDDIAKDDVMYESVAKSKMQRKLKKGTTEATEQMYQNIITNSASSLESKLQMIKDKIEKKEADKRKIEADIRKLENDAERAEKEANSTIVYHTKALERLYEDVPLDVVYPPSYFKKKETLRLIKASIENQSKNVLVMKAANYKTPKMSVAAEQRKKAAATARHEDAQLLAEARQRQEELEIAEALARKQEAKAEEARARELQAKHAQSKISYHQEAFENSDYDSEGELLTPKEKAIRKAEEEQERLADELWRREKGLPLFPKK